MTAPWEPSGLTRLLGAFHELNKTALGNVQLGACSAPRGPAALIGQVCTAGDQEGTFPQDVPAENLVLSGTPA